MKSTFSEFVGRLERDFGAEALAVRHEVYFVAQGRGWPAASLRALGALARDVLLLLRRPTAPEPSHGSFVAVVSLPRANGWGCLQPFVEQAAIAGLHPLLLTHPRLRALELPYERISAPRLPLASVASTLWRAFRATRAAQPLGVVVACTIARRRLWVESLKRLHAHLPRVMICHNDFDMFSGAAIAAGRAFGASSACIQHGLPTDEFFPPTADRYLVWGESSEQVFVGQGYAPDRLMVGGFNRRWTVPARPLRGDRVLLISQTHTPIYGIDLRPIFRRMAEALANEPSLRLKILLHPEEVRLGHPYEGLENAAIGTPPHAELNSSDGSSVVVGFSSTAIIDAARAGHQVVGMKLAPRSSRGAWRVARPPVEGDPAEIATIVTRLFADPDFSARSADLQERWLERTFAVSNSTFTDSALFRFLCAEHF